MSNLLFFIGLLVLCVEARYDYTYTVDSPADKIKDNPGKCYVQEGDVGLLDKDADIKVPERCMRVKCLDGGKYKISACPPLAVEPPCYADYPDKPFPECCTFEIKCLSTPSPPTPRPRVNK